MKKVLLLLTSTLKLCYKCIYHNFKIKNCRKTNIFQWVEADSIKLSRSPTISTNLRSLYSRDKLVKITFKHTREISSKIPTLPIKASQEMTIILLRFRSFVFLSELMRSTLFQKTTHSEHVRWWKEKWHDMRKNYSQIAQSTWSDGNFLLYNFEYA